MGAVPCDGGRQYSGAVDRFGGIAEWSPCSFDASDYRQSEYGAEVSASLYAREMHTGAVYQSEAVDLKKGIWNKFAYQIPPMEGAVIDETGFCIHVKGERDDGRTIAVLIDDLYIDGRPSYTIEMGLESEEIWSQPHREITQFTKLKGLMYLEDGQLNLSSCDFGEAYTGRYDWKDYQAEFYVTPIIGEHHMVNVRVQGAIRSYAAAFLPGGKVGILKNENGYRLLIDTKFDWEPGKEYKLGVAVEGSKIKVAVNDQEVLEYLDTESPYLEGAIGISVQNCSRIKCRKIVVS